MAIGHVHSGRYLAVDDAKVCLRSASQHDKDQVWTLPHTSGPNTHNRVFEQRHIVRSLEGITTAIAEVDL